MSVGALWCVMQGEKIVWLAAKLVISVDVGSMRMCVILYLSILEICYFQDGLKSPKPIN